LMTQRCIDLSYSASIHGILNRYLCPFKAGFKLNPNAKAVFNFQ